MGEERWMRVCEETLDWALREMRGPEGGFTRRSCSGVRGEEDASTSGMKRRCEITAEAGLGADSVERVLGYWGVSATGNLEGKNILSRPARAARAATPRARRCLTALYARRDERARPGLDDKRICSWNALMIAALSDAGAAMGREDYLDAACACARFVFDSMRDPEGRLLRPGRRAWQAERLPGGPCSLVEGSLRLYEFAGLRCRARDRRRDDRAFRRSKSRFFTTSHDHEALIARRQGRRRSSDPIWKSSAAFGLLRLAALTGSGATRSRPWARCACSPGGRPPSRRLRTPASGDRLPPLPRPRGGLGRPGGRRLHPARRAGRRVRSAHRPHVVLAGGPEGTKRPRAAPGAARGGGLRCRLRL